MKTTHRFAAAVFITTGAAFPAFAQDAATQAVLEANQQAAVLQTQQYNEQVNHAGAGLAGDPSYCSAYGTCKNNSPHDGGAIDLNPLIFGLLQQEPAPVVASQETIPAPHHRYHHRRTHGS